MTKIQWLTSHWATLYVHYICQVGYSVYCHSHDAFKSVFLFLS